MEAYNFTQYEFHFGVKSLDDFTSEFSRDTDIGRIEISGAGCESGEVEVKAGVSDSKKDE